LPSTFFDQVLELQDRLEHEGVRANYGLPDASLLDEKEKAMVREMCNVSYTCSLF